MCNLKADFLGVRSGKEPSSSCGAEARRWPSYSVLRSPIRKLPVGTLRRRRKKRRKGGRKWLYGTSSLFPNAPPLRKRKESQSTKSLVAAAEKVNLYRTHFTQSYAPLRHQSLKRLFLPGEDTNRTRGFVSSSGGTCFCRKQPLVDDIFFSSPPIRRRFYLPPSRLAYCNSTLEERLKPKFVFLLPPPSSSFLLPPPLSSPSSLSFGGSLPSSPSSSKEGWGGSCGDGREGRGKPTFCLSPPPPACRLISWEEEEGGGI